MFLEHERQSKTELNHGPTNTSFRVDLNQIEIKSHFVESKVKCPMNS